MHTEALSWVQADAEITRTSPFLNFQDSFDSQLTFDMSGRLIACVKRTRQSEVYSRYRGRLSGAGSLMPSLTIPATGLDNLVSRGNQW